MAGFKLGSLEKGEQVDHLTTTTANKETTPASLLP